MSRLTRPYAPGDDVYINHLYHKVTGTVRQEAEYSWEWINTWDGPGSIWLVFDTERSEGDQLIAQYSLIPTPITFWGKPYKAGKTENCMSHPDFRGKGMYFHHEKKYFEEAKEKFQVFFTTTGDVAKGAPGKVRQKLGYRAFDYWVTYTMWLNQEDLLHEVHSKLPTVLKKIAFLGKAISKSVTWALMRSVLSVHPQQAVVIQDHSESDAPLDQIELLWRENSKIYGISIDRTKVYLQWRINDNPYMTHQYLCYYEKDQLLGYLIYTIQDRTVHIVDVLAAKKEERVFQGLFQRLKDISIERHMSQLKCYTASKNMFLINMLKSSHFRNYSELFQIGPSKVKKRPPQLFVYVSNEVNSDSDVWDNQYWYITDLLKEGRPYTARPIE